MDIIEEKCRKEYKEDFIEDVMKRATISTKKAFKKSPVKYSESGMPVPEYVVKSAIALYMDSLLDDGQPKYVAAADELIDLFDKDSFSGFLRIIGDRVYKRFKEEAYDFEIYGIQIYDYMIPLLCKYTDDTASICMDLYRVLNRYLEENDDWNYGGVENVEAYNELLTNGIMMSDSMDAVEFCKSKGIIDRYAFIRGKSVSEFSEGDEIGSASSENEMEITKAIMIYDEYLKKLDKLMDGYYNYPTVEECYGLGQISRDNTKAQEFFEAICNKYKKGTESVGCYYDYTYEPDELQKLWNSNSTVEEGQTGLCFTIGLAVAYYMFETKDTDAVIVYCRDKWEYRGDYSSETRAAIKIAPKVEEWKVYNKKGYQVFDM